ncbi:methyl-accepting chemotaxis protein [Thermodesulfovibrio hydrogeniphilus]
MLSVLKIFKPQNNGKNGTGELDFLRNETLKRVLENSVKLIELVPCIENETKTLLSGTSEIKSSVEETSSKMHILNRVVEQVSSFSRRNFEGINFLSQNINDVKSSFTETEESMMAVKEAVILLSETSKKMDETIRIISKLATTIKDIADKTKLLSINASIEAVHAGEYGRGFEVVAQEVGKLAQVTMEATKDVTSKTKDIFELIDRVTKGIKSIEEQVGKTMQNLIQNNEKLNAVEKPIGELTSNAKKLDEISFQLRETSNVVENSVVVLSEFIKKLLSSSSSLNQCADNLHKLSEEQILDIGKVRIGIHQMAKKIIEEAANSEEIKSMHRFTMENYLRDLFKNYNIFELLYVTDEYGRQITDNISGEEFKAQYGSTGFGEDWSNREWFVRAVELQSSYISDIYISVATNSYCFTVSTPIFDKNGKLIGVLGADIDLKKIIS